MACMGLLPGKPADCVYIPMIRSESKEESFKALSVMSDAFVLLDAIK